MSTRYLSEWENRYWNCRFWHGSRLHSFLNATFRPSHANKNLHPEEGN